MANEDTDLQKIKEIIEIMEEKNLLEVEIKHGDDKIFLKRYQPQQSAAIALPMISQNVPAPDAIQGPAAGAKPSAPEQDISLVEIKSPLVGTFYAQPSPDSEPFIEVGTQVSPQTVICIIEAMKVMNEIKADTSGTVVEVLVTSGQAVEYGQVLFKVKPD